MSRICGHSVLQGVLNECTLTTLRPSPPLRGLPPLGYPDPQARVRYTSSTHSGGDMQTRMSYASRVSTGACSQGARSISYGLYTRALNPHAHTHTHSRTCCVHGRRRLHGVSIHSSVYSRTYEYAVVRVCSTTHSRRRVHAGETISSSVHSNTNEHSRVIVWRGRQSTTSESQEMENLPPARKSGGGEIQGGAVTPAQISEKFWGFVLKACGGIRG